MTQASQVRVADVMIPTMHSIDGLATVTQAMDMMRQHRVNSLAVNRRDENDEMGIVAITDIAREVVARNRAPDRVNVYEIMTKPVLTLPADMMARYAVRMLVHFEISRAVVVDRDRNPIGMATLRDLVLGGPTGRRIHPPIPPDLG